MRNRILLGCLLIGLLWPSLHKAQQVVVKTNPIKYLFRTPNLGLEVVVTDRISGVLYSRYSLYSKGSATDDAGKIKCRGLGFTPEVRFYLQKKKDVLNGFYGAPFAVTNFYRFTYEKIHEEYGAGKGTAKAAILGGGGTLGYQAILKNGLAIDFFGGLGLNVASANSVKVKYGEAFEEKVPIGLNIAGVLPRFGLSLGYAF